MDEDPSPSRRECDRIRKVYSARDRVGKQDLYAWNKPDVLLNRYRFRALIAREFVRLGWHDLSGLEFLDVGCGEGWWLRILLEWGVPATSLHGIDLLPDRVARALERNPQMDIQLGGEAGIPFPDQSIDLVSALTVFSSILDTGKREELAGEMQRVLKDEGLLLIYDFRISHPRNPNTTGIPKAEIRRLFPGVRFRTLTLTLAPPLQRRIARFSAAAAHLMEATLPFLRTHACHLGTLPSGAGGGVAERSVKP